MIFLSFLHGGTGKYWELKRDENARERKQIYLNQREGMRNKRLHCVLVLIFSGMIFADYAKKKRRSAHNAMSLR